MDGVTITPNGCRVLDALGILDRIAPKCFKQEKITYKNSRDETVEIVELASRERYGYQFHRLYRKELLAELKIMLEERGIQIEYGTKFERVVSESAETGVVFELGGGRVEHAAFLVGADGIWSSVRKHISPCIPEYTGTVSVSAHIPTASVPWPDGSFSNRYCTIQGKPGALFVIPEVADGSEILVGRQFAHEDLGRDGWETLDADHQRLISLFRRNYEDWHPTAQGVIDQACIRASEVLLWPYTKVLKLERMEELQLWVTLLTRYLLHLGKV
ncbi:hypothetical protein SLS56_010565 [Neofusicoccum ribis]|uniref:FAD-binding domain-containing protein n=1 Tax=Neofusicoccum ribis TaxID=45134 RepID=A0ABR3SES5_9PEZI